VELLFTSIGKKVGQSGKERPNLINDYFSEMGLY
jgi:hypothetical protein